MVARLREAGAIVVGKTTTHEFAFGPTGDRAGNGPCGNPYDPTRMAGGSSAGSAAAVGAGLVPLAVGTDTGGSVRIPAALCGAVGAYLDEVVTDDAGGRMFVCSDTDYCEGRRASEADSQPQAGAGK